ACLSRAESPRHARTRRQVARRRPAVRSTTPLPVPEEDSGSRCCARLSKGRKIAPAVTLVQRVLVVGGVGSIDLGRAMSVVQRLALGPEELRPSTSEACDGRSPRDPHPTPFV